MGNRGTEPKPKLSWERHHDAPHEGTPAEGISEITLTAGPTCRGAVRMRPFTGSRGDRKVTERGPGTGCAGSLSPTPYGNISAQRPGEVPKCGQLNTCGGDLNPGNREGSSLISEGNLAGLGEPLEDQSR